MQSSFELFNQPQMPLDSAFAAKGPPEGEPQDGMVLLDDVIDCKKPEDLRGVQVCIGEEKSKLSPKELNFLENIPELKLFAGMLQEIPATLTNLVFLNTKAIKIPPLPNLKVLWATNSRIDLADFPKLEEYNGEEVKQWKHARARLMRRVKSCLPG